jgi:hypothetical protein
MLFFFLVDWNIVKPHKIIVKDPKHFLLKSFERKIVLFVNKKGKFLSIKCHLTKKLLDLIKLVG